MNGARIKNKWAVEGLSGESDGMASQSKGLAIHVNQEGKMKAGRFRNRQEGSLGCSSPGSVSIPGSVRIPGGKVNC